MRGILLLGARRRIFFIQRLAACISEYFPEYRLVAADTDDLDPVRHFVNKFSVLPPSSEDDFIEHLISIVCRYNIRLIIPWNDQDIMVLNRFRKELASHGADLCAPPPYYVDLFCDKLLTSRWAGTHQINHPEVVTQPDGVRFPLIRKPRFGQGSQNVVKVSTHHEFKLSYLSDDNMIVQEFIEGDEFTVDVGLNGSSTPFFIIPRKRIKTRGGEVLIAETSFRPDIIEFVENIVETFRFNGVFNLQLIKSKNDIYLIEFNPRFGGGSDLSIYIGADIPQYIMEILQYGRITSPRPCSTQRVVMSRYHASVFYSREVASYD